MTGVIPAWHDPRFAVFLSWAATKKARATASSKRRDQFSDKTQVIYESLWRGWVEWLTARDRRWEDATPEDVRQFLDGPAPAPIDRPTRRPIEAKKMANYTQQRFWRVLQAVYAHAKLNDLVAQSPCIDVSRKPHITERSQQRQTMVPGVLELLRDPQQLRRLIPHESERQWWALRDRASLALAVHCALSTGELTALRGRDLRHGVAMLAPLQPELPGMSDDPPAWAVDIPATEERLAHTVPIPPEAMELIQPWLAYRATVLAALQRDFAAGRIAHAPPGLADAPLLLSRETRPGEVVSAVDARVVWHVFRKCIDAAIRATGFDLDGSYLARGPGILRNSVIVDWTERFGPDKATELAGLKPGSLRPVDRKPAVLAREKASRHKKGRAGDAQPASSSSRRAAGDDPTEPARM